MSKFLRRISLASLFVFCLSSFAIAQDPPAQAQDVDEGDSGNKVTRIGVIMPRVQLREATGEVEPGAALRNTYAALLNSETIEIVALSANLTSLALKEAKEKEVDYILKLSLLQEKKKSGGGLFGKIARDTGRSATWEAAGKVPYGGGTGERVARRAAQSAIINSGYTMSNMSYKVGKSDKFTLDYLLTGTTGQTVLEKSINAKAKKKNDDKVLLKLIEESANDVVKAIGKG